MSDMDTTHGSESIDESGDFGFGAVDVLFAILTLPLLFWALMYAVTGHEQLYATRAGRMRVYLLLLAIEVVIAAIVGYWIAR
jgi:hypothetical protein